MSLTLSLITVVYNSVDELEVTLNNIRHLKLNLDVRNKIEYILIDGNSNEATQKLIMNNKDIIDVFITESDTGIYNAMNKALPLVSAQWFSYINAGDTLIIDNFPKVIETLDSSSSIPVVYGGFNEVFADMIIKKEPVEIKHPSELVLKNPICHQSSFYATNYFRETRNVLFDESFKLIADQKLLCDLAYDSISNLKPMNVIVSNYDTTGISSINRNLVQKERVKLCNHLISNGKLPFIKWSLKIVILGFKAYLFDLMRYMNLLSIYRKFKFKFKL